MAIGWSSSMAQYGLSSKFGWQVEKKFDRPKSRFIVLVEQRVVVPLPRELRPSVWVLAPMILPV